MAKNIAVFLDGTGNLFKEENSNVVKLFQISRRCPGEQIAYYDPGVGTLADPSFKTPVGKRFSQIMGAAFGRGLIRNVEEAYSYLMEHFDEGDHIFIFGFSRGAYTARALAAFINRCGLFEKGCQNLLPYAMKLFLEPLPNGADTERKRRYHEVRSTFRKTYGRRFRKADGGLSWQTPIRFLGLWDTVKSYGWVYDPVRIPRESTNESVEVVRHAVALDEKRVLFPQLHWQRKPAEQDVREVWFAGVHSDVGGGYAEGTSGLAKLSLRWMVGEAQACGLQIDDGEYRRIVLGHGAGMAAPDHGGLQHESLKGPWHIAEKLPRRRDDGGIAWWPRGAAERARAVPGSVVLHGSVLDRMADGGTVDWHEARTAYAPPQLPALTAAQAAQLKSGQPVVLPQALLLPLPDGSGDVLLHRLNDAERAALLAALPADAAAALHTLASAATAAMRDAVPAPALLALLQPALDAAAGDDARAAAWLGALPAAHDEAGAKALAGRVAGVLRDARQLLRWLAEADRSAGAGRTDAQAGADADAGADAGADADAGAGAGAESQAVLLARYRAAGSAAGDEARAAAAAALLQADPPAAQRSNVAALRAAGEGGTVALLHALWPRAALTALEEACAAVSGAVDSRTELAQVPLLLQQGSSDASSIDKLVTHLTRFANRRGLLPAHEAALRRAGGNTVESLLTAAARLRTRR